MFAACARIFFARMTSKCGKLRIALITNNYTPYSGGVVSSINAQVAALQEDGHIIRVITLDFLGVGHSDPDYVVRIRTPLKFRRKNNHYAIPWYMITQIREVVTAMNTDIVHVHHPFLLGVGGLKVVHELNIPIVFTYHTMYEEYAHYVPFFSGAAKPCISWLVRSFCNAVDGVIVPSSTIAQYLSEQSVRTALSCIPSPLQSNFLGIPFSGRKRLSSDPFKLLTVVRFTKEKNVPFILDVFSHLDERFYLTLVGYGAEYQNLRSYAYDHLKLSPDHLQFVLKPSPEQIIEYYREADLFLFSSKTDTQGLVLAEAMAFSTPVIALTGPGQNDIIRNEENGLLVSTEQEMVNGIHHCSEQIELQSAMQKKAWQTAQNYLPDQYRERLLQFYWQVINGYQG